MQQRPFGRVTLDDIFTVIAGGLRIKGFGRAHPVMRARRSSSSISVESGRLRRWRLSGRSGEPEMSGGGAKLNRAEELVILLLFMEEIAKMQAPAVEYSIELSKNGKDWTPVQRRFDSFPSPASVAT